MLTGGDTTLIYGGLVVTDIEAVPLDVLIQGEKIIKLDKHIEPQEEWNVINAVGHVIFPGGIDPHTHLDSRWEGLVTADDWLSGTIAAAAGGTTTIIDFCRPEKDQPLMEAVDDWKARAQHKSVVDYSFHLVIRDAGESRLQEMEVAVQHGLPSFKLFMAYKDSLQLSDRELFQILQRIRELDGIALVHCENGDVIEVLIEQAIAAGNTAPIYHALTRPPELEGEATGRIIRLAQITETPIYIPHVTCKQSMLEIQNAHARGQLVVAETCPQYLFIDQDYLLQPDFEAAKYVWSPPPRKTWHQSYLWESIKNGDIQTIGSDHSSYNFVGQKDIGKDDFTKIPNGGPSIEDRMSLLYHFGVVQGKLNLNQFVHLTSTNAAKTFGLFPNKGVIAEGSDADLVIWNPNLKRTISAGSHHMNVDYSIFEGIEVTGIAVQVMVRGQTIFHEGTFVGKPGSGKFISRQIIAKDMQSLLTKDVNP
ncbi:dihydropyrimidinase [Paenibacillus sp. yr247]|uniref:dihydropyrimidinase n=1 Tax=Paenibacillus sp. yr247 TaxID=1761880 RepID=UPI0008804988|nr:dihydropyrimidinase [Paenibacillus sp. yr247]SDO33248.1 dihydropyrimidinase [Paenibacillus sp. yr247]